MKTLQEYEKEFEILNNDLVYEIKKRLLDSGDITVEDTIYITDPDGEFKELKVNKIEKSGYIFTVSSDGTYPLHNINYLNIYDKFIVFKLIQKYEKANN